MTPAPRGFGPPDPTWHARAPLDSLFYIFYLSETAVGSQMFLARLDREPQRGAACKLTCLVGHMYLVGHTKKNTMAYLVRLAKRMSIHTSRRMPNATRLCTYALRYDIRGCTHVYTHVHTNAYAHVCTHTPSGTTS